MISRIKAKLFKSPPSYSIDSLINEIENLAEKSQVIAICPAATGPNWKGVNISTRSMFPNNWMELPQYYSNQVVEDNDLISLFKAFKAKGGTAIVFNGFPKYFIKVLNFAKAEGLKIGAAFSGGLSEFSGMLQEEISLLNILKLKREGVVDEIAIMKGGLDLCLSDLLKEKVYRIHPSIHSVSAQKLNLDKEKTHIGVFGNSSYNKNRHNQVAAALSVENSIVHLAYDNEFEYLDFDGRIVVHDDLGREDFLSLVGSMDINLYISYSESWGQVITESISMGVPCLASNNSGILSYNKALEEQLVVVEYDNPKEISNRIKHVLNSDPEVLYERFIEDLNIGAKDLMDEFLLSFKN